MKKLNNKALVIFSGGMDSTVCLGWALNNFSEVEAVSFGYGQKHSVELEQARWICFNKNIKWNFIDISFFSTIVESALTSNGNVNEKHKQHKNLPASFVPNRNAMFITIAHAYAQKIGFDNLIFGACQADEMGYPDCREDFVKEIQRTLNMGSETNIVIHTPIIFKTKEEIFEMAEREGILNEVLEDSHTCYNGDREKRHPWGYGCDSCPNCKLRKEGYQKYISRVKC